MNINGKLIDKESSKQIFVESTEDNILSKSEDINLETRLRGIEYSINYLNKILKKPLIGSIIKYNDDDFSALGENGYGFGMPGYIKLNCGLMIQWGRAYRPSASEPLWQMTYNQEFFNDYICTFCDTYVGTTTESISCIVVNVKSDNTEYDKKKEIWLRRFNTTTGNNVGSTSVPIFVLAIGRWK